MPMENRIIVRSFDDKIADLPKLCMARHVVTGEPIIIRKGSQGYWPTRPDISVERFNAHQGISAAQVEAMVCGSHVGFDVPGADPLNYADFADSCYYPAELIEKWRAELTAQRAEAFAKTPAVVFT